jgi:hypothetical protein
MTYFPFQNNGYDFHFVMRMGGKSGPRLDYIVIKNPQGSKLDIIRVIIFGKRE